MTNWNIWRAPRCLSKNINRPVDLLLAIVVFHQLIGTRFWANDTRAFVLPQSCWAWCSMRRKWILTDIFAVLLCPAMNILEDISMLSSIILKSFCQPMLIEMHWWRIASCTSPGPKNLAMKAYRWCWNREPLCLIIEWGRIVTSTFMMRNITIGTNFLRFGARTTTETNVLVIRIITRTYMSKHEVWPTSLQPATSPSECLCSWTRIVKQTTKILLTLRTLFSSV